MQFKLNDIKKETLPAIQEDKNEITVDSASYELFKKEYNNSLLNTHKEFVFFIDRSSSMMGTEIYMEKYFLNMINKYKKKNEGIHVTVVLFESEDNVLFYRKPIEEIDNLKYMADGCTKFYDTLVSNITNILDDQFKSSSLAFKTLVRILTDGKDNKSVNSTEIDLKRLIEYTKKLGWEYVLLSEYDLNMNIGINNVGIFNNKDRLVDCFKSVEKAIDSFIETDKVSDDWNESLSSNKRLLLTKKGE